MQTQDARNVAIAEIMQSLRRIFQAIQHYFQEISKKFGITGPQLWALKTISAHGEVDAFLFQTIKPGNWLIPDLNEEG